MILLLKIIVGLFLIEVALLLYQFSKAIYKYFIIKELNLIERYGSDTWVVITGASSGQGRDFSLEFAKRGFNILMIGSKRSHNTAKEIKELYPKVKTKIIEKDFRKAHEDNFFDDIKIAFNELGTRISILVNNVGYRTAWKPYHTMPSELIRDTIVTGTIVQSRLTQMVIPFFLEREKEHKSALINITAQCLHPNFLFGIGLSNEISVQYLSVYEASNAFGFYQGASIHKEYKDKFDILNITPGAVITKNTEYLKEYFNNCLASGLLDTGNVGFDDKIETEKYWDETIGIVNNIWNYTDEEYVDTLFKVEDKLATDMVFTHVNDQLTEDELKRGTEYIRPIKSRLWIEDKNTFNFK